MRFFFLLFSMLIASEFVLADNVVRCETALGLASENAVLRKQVRSHGLKRATLNQELVAQMPPDYKYVVPEASVGDQKKSGRCVIFTGCNMIRNELFAKNKVPKNFEFSESYTYYWHIYEQAANWIMGRSLVLLLRSVPEELSPKDVASFANATNSLTDSGSFDTFRNEVLKYGLVPRSQFPETATSRNTEFLLQTLSEQLTRVSFRLLKVYDDIQKSGAKTLTDEQVASIHQVQRGGIDYIRQTLTATLGDADPTRQFSFKAADGSRGKYDARSFAKDFAAFDFNQIVGFVSLPTETNPAPRLISKEGAPTPYLHVSPERLHQLVEQSVREGYSVPVGVKVDREVDPKTGIMHPDIYRLDRVLPLGDEAFPALTRLQSDIADAWQSNHGMTIIGSDQRSPDVGADWYLTENSWGKRVGSDGNFHMHRSWFDRGVSQVYIRRSLLNAEELAALAPPKASFIPPYAKYRNQPPAADGGVTAR